MYPGPAYPRRRRRCPLWDGVGLLELVRPQVAVPVHYDGVFRSPLSDFRKEAQLRQAAAWIRYVERGQTVPLTRTGATHLEAAPPDLPRALARGTSAVTLDQGDQP